MSKKCFFILESSIACGQGTIRNVEFSFDGVYCLTCGSNKSIQLWNPHKRLHVKSYSGHGYNALKTKITHDNAKFVSCGEDKNVSMWDVLAGKVVKKFKGHLGQVNCVSMNQDSSLLLSGSIDNSVKLWDCRARTEYKPIQSLEEGRDSILDVCCNDVVISSACADKYLRTYDIRKGLVFSDFLGSAVTRISLTKDGLCLLASTLDNVIRLLDLTNGELLGEYVGHLNTKYSIDACLSYDDMFVFSGSEDRNSAYVWNVLDGSIVAILSHEKVQDAHSIISCIASHPSEYFLLTSSASALNTWRSEQDD